MRRGEKEKVTAGVPIEYLIHVVAKQWGVPPWEVDPRLQRPGRAAHFWRELEFMKLESQFGR